MLVAAADARNLEVMVGGCSTVLIHYPVARIDGDATDSSRTMVHLLALSCRPFSKFDFWKLILIG